MSLPVPENVPNGVMISGITRGSFGYSSGSYGQWTGAVQLLEPPRIRSLRPWATCPTELPVCSFAHGHGCGCPHRALYAGQVNDGFLMYVGAQPATSSPRKFGIAGSQSIVWPWLPATRR